ncbi:MAG: hypothetical protein ACWA5A_00100 [Marinibacterium sp.]
MARWLGAAAVAVVALAPASRAADFGTETVCEGRMSFSNEDGTADLYDLMIWLEDGEYSVVSHDLASGEVLEDRGTCDLSRDRVCKHYVETDDPSLNDAYAFMLTPLEQGRYLYTEIWLDGSQGRGVVACFSAR